MRILRLDIKAYGPFTDQVWEFDTDNPGLHIIFGPNEAGKSSSLRALKAWLFGFPEQTGDDFCHAYENLLVGGSLVSRNGEQLTFYRRKRRKADLVDATGHPIDVGNLSTFIPIRDQQVFETLYGIDHTSLVRGGEDILAQRGEIGQTLFSAGTGISSLKQIAEKLNADAEELFKKQGRKQKINESINRYKSIQKTIKEVTLHGRNWKTLVDELDSAEKRLKELDTRLATEERDRRRLERIRQALPQLLQRDKLLRSIEELREVVDLPPGFSEERRLAEEKCRYLKRDQEEVQRRLKELDEQAGNLAINQSLLDQGTVIRKLQKELGAYEKAMLDRPKLEGMCSTCRSDARLSLKQINPELDFSHIEELRPAFGKRKLIRSQAAKHEEIQQDLRQAEKKTRKLDQDLKATLEKLEKLPETTESPGLKQMLKQARQLGDIDTTVAGKQQELDDIFRRCRQELAKLGLWKGDLSELPSLPLPLPETVTTYENRFQELASEIRETKKQRTDVVDRIHELQKQMRILQDGDQPPTEDDLLRVRAERDSGWQLLRRQWIDGEDVSEAVRQYDAELDLPEAYELRINWADQTVDRLRREADRVHQHTVMKAEKASLEKQLSATEAFEQQLEDRRKALQDEWQGCWQPADIKPLSPREMFAWLSHVAALVSSIQSGQKIRGEIEALHGQRTRCRQAVLDELPRLVKELAQDEQDLLSPVLERAEQILEQMEVGSRQRRDLEEKRIQLETEQARLREETDQTNAALKSWKQQWQDLMHPFGKNREFQPEEAADLLDHLQDCFGKLKEAEDFQKRISGIDSDAAAFTMTVSKLVDAVAPELADLPVEQAVSRLDADLKKASDNQKQQLENRKERQNLKSRFEKNTADTKMYEGILAEQCRTARVDAVEDLPSAEERSESRRRLQSALADVEQTLIEGADGLTIEELVKQAEEADSDELAVRISQIDRRIREELNPEIRRLSESIGQKRTEIGRMDGNAMAADAMEEGTQELALMGRLVNRYVTLKLSTRILNKEIERFRAENQDPILRIASRYFQRLTLGSFQELRTDEDLQGNPVLVGLRIDGSRLFVEQMSTGTRDQLYLALRLASLEWKHQSGESMPFILDDILVNFDDNRSHAALQAMAELSKHIQVILFTHHRQVIEEAERLSDIPDLRIHEFRRSI